MFSSVLENKYKTTAPLHTLSGFHTSISFCKSGDNSEFWWEKLLMENAASHFWILKDSKYLSLEQQQNNSKCKNKATTQFPGEKGACYYA